MRRIARSASTPITESWGPVMPASVMNAVPFGRTFASDVWTWVCVPRTAVTRPSSQRASAAFSLVASAWTSTRTTGVSRLAASTSSSMTSNIDVAGCKKREPRTLITPRRPPSVVGTTVRPRPGVLRVMLAGRTTRSEDGRYSLISVRRKA